MYTKLSIPERLKDLRVVDKHLTLEQLAEQTGLSKSALGKYETDDYKDNADTIIGNMDSQIFLGGSEPTTLKELAEALGKETIDTINTSDTRGNSPSYGTNYQKLGKEVLCLGDFYFPSAPSGSQRIRRKIPPALQSQTG